MMKPDFSRMTRQALRAYILANREDADAIAALIKMGNSNSPKFPFPKTNEDLSEMQALLQKKLNNI